MSSAPRRRYVTAIPSAATASPRSLYTPARWVTEARVRSMNPLCPLRCCRMTSDLVLRLLQHGRQAGCCHRALTEEREHHHQWIRVGSPFRRQGADEPRHCRVRGAAQQRHGDAMPVGGEARRTVTDPGHLGVHPVDAHTGVLGETQAAHCRCKRGVTRPGTDDEEVVCRDPRHEVPRRGHGQAGARVFHLDGLAHPVLTVHIPVHDGFTDRALRKVRDEQLLTRRQVHGRAVGSAVDEFEASQQHGEPRPGKPLVDRALPGARLTVCS